MVLGRSGITSVGNPMTSLQMVDKICTKLTGCFSGLAREQCQTGVKSTLGLTDHLGVAPGSVYTMNELINSEAAGLVKANTSTQVLCFDDVQSLSCGADAVQGAYKAADAAPFAGVSGMFSQNCSAAYQTGNYAWLVGGEQGSPHNNVYRTGDFKSWNMIATLPGLRTRMASVRFSDSMWVFGGWDGGAAQNSVWYSYNGIQWQTAGPLPGGRFSPSSVFFNQKIWVIGGATAMSMTSGTNQIWSSSDGFNWTAAGTFPINVYEASAIVYKGAIYHVGGALTPSNPISTVYKSTDGVNWSVVGNLPSPRRMGALTVFGGKLIWIGGYGPSIQATEIYESADGVNWTFFGNMAVQTAGASFWTMLGKLWFYSSASMYNSLDGTSWMAEGQPPIFTSMGGSSSFVFGY